MQSFKEALQSGITTARQSNANRQTILSLLDKLGADIFELTSGRVSIDVKPMRMTADTRSLLGSAFEKNVYQIALVSESKRIAMFELALTATSIPCAIVRDKDIVVSNSLRDFEAALVDMASSNYFGSAVVRLSDPLPEPDIEQSTSD